MNNSPEKTAPTSETEAPASHELERLRHEQHEALRQNVEQKVEVGHETDVDNLHEKALEHATSAADEKKAHAVSSPAERRTRGPISRKERDASFSATMTEVRSHMAAPSRVFSTVIHTKAVEKTSEVVGNSIARPNAILSGAIAAFIVTLSVYLVAKNYGYPLSGFESIFAFAIGWVLGLVYDFLRIMITGKS